MSLASRSNKPLAKKLWREAVRPAKQFLRVVGSPLETSDSSVEGLGDEVPVSPETYSIANFHPGDCTVEPEGLELIKNLVKESGQFQGPIIEIGTLLGITATEMALVKADHQKLIAVDAFCWNPWCLSPDVHADLARQILHYPISRGDVELIRQDKNEFFDEYNGPAPSMVFLDAIHDYEETKKDIEWAQRIGAKIISGHDYCDQFPGVIEVVDEFGGPRQLGGTVWVL